jgi:hypothetical protein
MKHEEIVIQLENNLGMIRGLVCGLEENQASWRPEEGKWSILEVINHLYDEERDDFRKRLDLTLHQPDTAWPPIDPEAWAKERKYNERDFDPSLENLLAERRKSIAWLKELRSPDWEAAYEHPAFGKILAGDLLCAWLAHDYFHARQMSNLLLEYTRILSEPYSTRYAF